jgi:parallel beta-helix repeat protein
MQIPTPRKSIVLFLLFTLIVVTASPVAAGAGGPLTIRKPGVYTLTQDIKATSGLIGIDIRSSNVVIDGNGHSVTGVGRRESYGVWAHGSALSNVTIRDLSVVSWQYGIAYDTVRNGRIEDCLIESSTLYGIRLTRSRENRIIKNTVKKTGYWALNVQTGSDSNVISENTVNNNPVGIRVQGSTGNTIYNNFFDNDINAGFCMPLRSNAWSVSPRSGTNIVGGPSIGGNYWAQPDGRGFSQVTPDLNGDGFCDLPYAIISGNTDSKPLSRS